MKNRKTYQQDERTRRLLQRQKLKGVLSEWLSIQPDKVALKEDFINKITDRSDEQTYLSGGDFIVFDFKGSTWVQNLRDHTPEIAKLVGEEAERKMDAAWRACEPLCGDWVRPGASKAKTAKLKVVAHTYTPETTAKRLVLSVLVVNEAIHKQVIPSFTDPEGKIRVPAHAVETALADAEQWEKIAYYTPLRVRHIALAADLSDTTVRSRLNRAGFSTTEPLWGQVRGTWGLPKGLNEFKAIVAERFPAWLETVAEEKRAGRWDSGEKVGIALGNERRTRDALRQKLFEIFPAWDSNRNGQQIFLHLGPTNSGKTFNSLTQLVSAGSGWYLAPLRLLAHEVFATLNKDGVACNLLTGEESIEVDGAEITAATIEMFNPIRSGNCIVIDEAYMLSDSQRGWAWTRAMMENNAKEVHIIGAAIIEPLITRMAAEIGIKIEVENYSRLTPLEVSDQPWSLKNLPDKTILVAFSRKVVLGLKTELEKVHHRSVSVVYGNLPPEVRLNQAERFAKGQTDICVATDAIGMGLNLPADNVCFYETSKFDGKTVRQLTANEIRQIGGRAGRYGLSDKGLIGSLTREDLAFIRGSIESQTTDIEFARVAPTSESIALMPGDLGEKLQKWVELSGIPPRWREMLKPVDLSSQIELARLLTPDDVEKLGDDAALQLINAPCYRESQDYWLRCATAIIHEFEMPTLINPKKEINSASDLETFETAIRCADIYLWLSQRERFARFAPAHKSVRAKRDQWSRDVDAALHKQVDTTRRCSACGKKLALDYRYNICNHCFRGRRYE